MSYSHESLHRLLQVRKNQNLHFNQDFGQDEQYHKEQRRLPETHLPLPVTKAVSGAFRPLNASVALPVVAMSVGSAVLVTVDIKPDRVDDFLKVGTPDG